MELALYSTSALQRRVGRRASLSSYPWLGFTAPARAKLTDEWMRTNVPAARVVCRYEDAMSMYAALRAGAGVGFMPCAFADPDPKLVRLRGVQRDFGVDLWCLTHADLSQTARVRAALAHVGAYFDTRRDLYAGKQAGRPHRRRAGR